MKHFAIESKGLSVKQIWMQQLLKGEGEIPFLQGKKGLLFSTITLDKFIDEELRHDKFLLTDKGGRSIRTYSSGEQRKELLKYQMQQKPDFLVLDNPFDCLDTESVHQLKIQLEKVAENIPIIQLFKRHTDILPFITKVLEMLPGGTLYWHPVQAYILNAAKHLQSLHVTIPSALKPFENTPRVLVDMNRVSVSYNNQIIVKDICWKIKKGEFWHLKGSNGSGKTTLLSMIYGDNPKAYGQELYLFGHKKGSGESVWSIKEKIGYFTPSLTDNFRGSHNALQMIISGLMDSVGLYAKPSDLQKKLAQDWLRVINMDDKKHHPFSELSQINQRLVLIARAMIKHPPLLILDEPSTGIDDESARLLVALVNQIARQSNSAIIYVSHRTEPGLKPHFTFELVKSNEGSTGRVVVDALINRPLDNRH